MEKGDGWLHKRVRNEAQPSATICSDLLITGLPQNYTVEDVEKHFSFCGAIVNTKQVAVDLASFPFFYTTRPGPRHSKSTDPNF